MSFPLNKFEKEKRVIELHLEGKTIREIAKEVRMSFRDISKLNKAYDKKIRLRQIRKENSQPTTKKPSLSSRVFKLFSDGKTSTEVIVELDIPPEKVEKLWSQFLKSERMEECYDFFQECQYDIQTLLSINNFMQRNKVYGNDIVNVLRAANDVIKLNQMVSNLKTEIEKLKQIKNNYSINQNTNSQPLLPLGLSKSYYEYLL
jgi:uncharacterized protein YerC